MRMSLDLSDLEFLHIHTPMFDSKGQENSVRTRYLNSWHLKAQSEPLRDTYEHIMNCKTRGELIKSQA